MWRIHLPPNFFVPVEFSNNGWEARGGENWNWKRIGLDVTGQGVQANHWDLWHGSTGDWKRRGAVGGGRNVVYWAEERAVGKPYARFNVPSIKEFEREMRTMGGDGAVLACWPLGFIPWRRRRWKKIGDFSEMMRRAPRPTPSKPCFTEPRRCRRTRRWMRYCGEVHDLLPRTHAQERGKWIRPPAIEWA
jgi:hypothetical protein